MSINRKPWAEISISEKSINVFLQKSNYGGKIMAKGEEKKYAKIRSLRDIIGGINSTKEQREIAWQKLLPIEDNFGFSTIIAAKYSWLEFSKKYKEKSWKELIRRRIKDDMLSLHYLSANAPEPWCDLAKNLENELEEKLAKKVKK